MNLGLLDSEFEHLTAATDKNRYGYPAATPTSDEEVVLQVQPIPQVAQNSVQQRMFANSAYLVGEKTQFNTVMPSRFYPQSEMEIPDPIKHAQPSEENKFANIFHQIFLLWNEEQYDEDGYPLRPSFKAMTRSANVLRKTETLLRDGNDHGLPKGHVTSDTQGGIRIEWWGNLGNCVTVSIQKITKKSFIFFKKDSSDCGDLERTSDPKRLAFHLKNLFS